MQPSARSIFDAEPPAGSYRPNGSAPPHGYSGNTGNTARKARRKRVGAGVILGAVYEPLRWIVPDYLPEGLSILAGRQKLGKTWLALDWAIAVASGGAAMGNISVDQGDVLYIDLENGERRVQRRLERIFPYPPVRPDLSRLQFQFDASEIGPGLIAELDDWRESVETPRLIVIDVLQRIKPAGRVSRNSYENDYSALADLQRWATKYGIAVLMLHHTRKGGADDPLEALSGSNGLSACADTTLVLDRTAGGITLYVRGRDVDERETALKFDAGLWSILGDADEWKRSGERSAIIKVLKDADEPMSPAEIAAATGMPGGNVRKLLFAMTKAGQLTKVGYGRYIHPDRADLAGGDDEDNVVESPAADQRRKRGNTGNTGNTSPKSEGTRGPANTPTAPDPQDTGNTSPDRDGAGNSARGDDA